MILTPDQKALLKDIRVNASKTREFGVKLRIGILWAHNAEVTRDVIVTSIVQAGWSSSRARALVGIVMRSQGIKARKKGAGRKTGGHAIRMVNYAVKFMKGDRRAALPVLLAAYRHLSKQLQGKDESPIPSFAEIVTQEIAQQAEAIPAYADPAKSVGDAVQRPR